jgi:hypothetical protein
LDSLHKASGYTVEITVDIMQEIIVFNLGFFFEVSIIEDHLFLEEYVNHSKEKEINSSFDANLLACIQFQRKFHIPCIYELILTLVYFGIGIYLY